MVDYDETVAGYLTSQKMPPCRPDPEPRAKRYKFVSVDDHLVEPPHVFKDRLPNHLKDSAPRVERGADGNDYWVFGADKVPLTSADALQSWDAKDWSLTKINFEQIRPGTYDVKERIRDMDIGGIDASLCFPSTIFGFAGQRFMRFEDEELGLASMIAYNDWMAEEWVGTDPTRMIACQVTWLKDVETAAKEILRNAERGFRAVAFTENPEKLDLPSLYSGYWDPFFAACEETETVVNIHVGSSSQTIVPSADSPPQVLGALFAVNGMAACLDWIYAQIPVKFPALRITLSEAGIGWVPMLLDHLRHQAPLYRPEAMGRGWAAVDMTPEEILRRNFWFSAYDGPLALKQRADIGVDRILLESDYPHFDSTWPDTQELVHSLIGDFSPGERDRLTHLNACELYGHTLAE